MKVVFDNKECKMVSRLHVFCEVRVDGIVIYSSLYDVDVLFSGLKDVTLVLIVPKRQASNECPQKEVLMRRGNVYYQMFHSLV